MTTEDDEKRDRTPSDQPGFPEELRDPVRRRAWLLAKALQAQPLDRALDLARSAEGFITGSVDNEAPTQPKPAEVEDPSTAAQASPVERPPKRPPVSLAPEARERLLDRLARGAR